VTEGGEDDNVVKLTVKARPDAAKRGEVFLATRRPKHGECRHAEGFVLDEAQALVECIKCSARIDPLHVLRLFAEKEARALESYTLAKEAAEVLEARRRFNCEHCGKVSVNKQDARHIKRLYKDGA